MIKQHPLALDGAKAVAEAMRQMNPDVVAAYPITPQTEIVQTFSQFVADGKVDTEFVPVESEHAAMSACIGAAAAGGRVQTATTSAGMALMWEVLYVASGLRLPIVYNTGGSSPAGRRGGHLYAGYEIRRRRDRPPLLPDPLKSSWRSKGLKRPG